MPWLLDNWTAVIGLLTALSGAVAGLWRLGVARFVRNRLTVELDLIECERRSEHREALMTDLITQIEFYKQWHGGLESESNDTTQPPTIPPAPSSQPPETLRT